MLVQDVMVKEVVCVEMDARLPEVKTLLQNRGFHHLPVVEQGKLVGIISDRDILRLVSPFVGKVNEQTRDLDTLNRAAHQVMTRQPITVKANAEVSDVVNWMLKVSISCVPVIDDDEAVIGIVTWRDLISHAKF
ncbi:CBS domain-containing protein [Marinomonas mediterranea]|uniref:CBS domain containing membrane protein n=1 Tax=Marinomonas mediterranea (strain ATCC 700492 / JCM 21426 / NBRC 103028 / MMB-1) TaxID=717774 RepID=F2K187_MARM1|nr:CBS domain-containing protein [Marinomonas mediterranea]ADZ89937.1 CBS domain containing membrane protein [Marinomonas mediterranea MMB-1]WCN08016.1 CBS domain-containing protein [Marinomonas mediterranea]WCN12111.1 CBS domain-containing protein [Marinomonas mediterranea]WCN16148.1 CBS domain-containing protein [Marinomonas mediterranea MMB-1]